jgi:hypothetical protein
VKEWFARLPEPRLPELADDSVEVVSMAVLGKPKK